MKRNNGKDFKLIMYSLLQDLLLLETALAEAASDTSTIAKVINRFARKTFPKQDSAFMR